jgi:competence ComEA-like helix-hairpin-helix protein
MIDRKNVYFWFLFVLSYSVFAVDINTATKEELAHELSGIGPVKAQRIVEYRDKIGGFVFVEQLTEVYGIGPKTLERNRDKIEISPLSKVPLPQPKVQEKIPVQNTPSLPPKKPLPNSSTNSQLPNPSTNSQPSRTTDASLDLSPEVEKPFRQAYNFFWDALIIIPLFIACLLIFATAWWKSARKR